MSCDNNSTLPERCCSLVNELRDSIDSVITIYTEGCCFTGVIGWRKQRCSQDYYPECPRMSKPQFIRKGNHYLHQPDRSSNILQYQCLNEYIRRYLPSG